MLLRVHLLAQRLVQGAQGVELLPCNRRCQIVHAHVTEKVPQHERVLVRNVQTPTAGLEKRKLGCIRQLIEHCATRGHDVDELRAPPALHVRAVSLGRMRDTDAGKNRLAVAHAAVKHELRTIGDAGQQDIDVDAFGSALQRVHILHVCCVISRMDFDSYASPLS